MKYLVAARRDIQLKRPFSSPAISAPPDCEIILPLLQTL